MSVFEEAKVRWTTEQVISRLGVPEASEKAKWACVWCDSSDAMGLTPRHGLAKCFSCGEVGDSIHVWAKTRGLSLLDAAREMTGTVPVLPAPVRPKRSQPRPPNVERARTIYGQLIERASLGQVGRKYLESRGLDADLCFHMGIRSLEPHEPLPVPSERHGGLYRPFEGRAVLVLPYLGHPWPSVEYVRFRKIDGAGPKYLAPRGSGRGPFIPFNVEAFDAPDGDVVICEGELNAVAATQMGYAACAVGSSSVSGELVANIARRCAHAARVRLWRDRDSAGEGLRDRLVARMTDDLGAGWLSRHFESLWTSGDAVDHLARVGT